jgi:Holliday junction resolvase RusA-like endonuclease
VADKVIDYVRIVVFGDAAPQGSKAFMGLTPDGKAKLREASKKNKPWRQQVSGTALLQRQQPLWDQAIRMKVTFYTARPKSLAKKYSRRTTRPDLSKLVRSVEDALEGIIYKDDGLIEETLSRKRFGQPARVVIELWHVPRTLPLDEDEHDSMVDPNVA